MYKLIIWLIVFALVTLSSGCQPKKGLNIKNEVPVSTNISSTEKVVLTTPGSSIEPTPLLNTPMQSPTHVPAQTEKLQTPKPEGLILSILDKLDNTMFGWGVGPNKEHKTPSISDSQKVLLKKYDGLYVGDVNKKIVYLTFDEGYENGYTGKILDTLKENNTKAIFFVTGSYITSQPDLVNRMLEEGHVVGNHTVNHYSLPTISNEALENEILGLEKQFRQLFGSELKYLRPPQGDHSEKTLATAQQLGYKTIFWSFAYVDYDVNNQKGAENAYNIVMDNLHNGAILLLHAVSKDNAEALDRIIKSIKAQGYVISPFEL